MLEFDRIDMSQGIDVNKINNSNKIIICHCWYFLQIYFRFQFEVCDVAIISVKEDYYRIYFWYMSKDKTINLFLQMLI